MTASDIFQILFVQQFIGFGIKELGLKKVTFQVV